MYRAVCVCGVIFRLLHRGVVSTVFFVTFRETLSEVMLV